MADLIKAFYEIGEAYKDEQIENYNEIRFKNIEKIVLFDVVNGDTHIYDKEAIEHRLFLRVTSPNGGNLFPFMFLSDKLADGLKKAFKNMNKYLPKEKHEELAKVEKEVNSEKIEKIIEEYKSEKNWYFALTYSSKTFNELYPEVISGYLNSATKGELEIDGYCFVANKSSIGFDPMLNFCSVNELPDKIAKNTKYRLLPLSQKSANFVQQGFSKVFDGQDFKFRLFSETYYLIPTIFFENKRQFFDLLQKSAKENRTAISSKVRLEENLEYLVESLMEEELAQKVLFTFLFAEKNNNEIKLNHTIEDVAPSRIKKASELMTRLEIDASNFSRYIKKSDYQKDALYIRDYMEDSLLLAKFIFEKEKIYSKEKLLELISNKIFFGNNQKNPAKREFSLVLNGYFVADTEFEKHQRFIDFLSSLNVLSFEAKNLVYGGEMSEIGNFVELIESKFDAAELLITPRAREFYVVGALARFVISWQHGEGSDAVEKYINSIGSVNTQNIERVFRKIHDGAKKYNMYGNELDALLSKYSEVKSTIKSSDNISIDRANIAFVMGSIDYKNYRSKSKEERAQ